MPVFDETQRWIANNGFAVVIAVLILAIVVAPLIALLRYVILDAVNHFNGRMDISTMEMSAGFREMSSAIRHLDSTLDKLSNQSAANHEAISNVLLFMSHTQQEVVAHRKAIEEGVSSPIPSPPSIGTIDDISRLEGSRRTEGEKVSSDTSTSDTTLSDEP
jgi:predicted PurR-regulated permease PerM